MRKTACHACCVDIRYCFAVAPVRTLRCVRDPLPDKHARTHLFFARARDFQQTIRDEWTNCSGKKKHDFKNILFWCCSQHKLCLVFSFLVFVLIRIECLFWCSFFAFVLWVLLVLVGASSYRAGNKRSRDGRLVNWREGRSESRRPPD